MEREYIKRCLELVVKKLQWGDSVDWTNSDFINLSKIIYEKTNISISHATLKRVFGKQKTDSKEQYNPQIDTKDALVKLIGYKDWIDFKDKIDVSDAEEVSHRKKNSSTFITRRKVINAILFLLLIGLIFLIYYHQTNIVNKKKILSKISFSINKTEGDVPLNIVINYDISKINREIIVDFGDKENRRYPSESVVLDKDKNTLTHCYGSPGYYKLALKTGGEKLLEKNILVTTDGWYSFVTYKVKAEKKYKIKEINNFVDTANGRLYVPPENIALDPLFEVDGYWVEFYNSKKFNIRGDQFALETRIKNPSDEGGFFCNDVIIYIYCQNGNIRLNYIGEGCSRWLKIQISDVIMNGINNDLSNFSIDMSEWHKINFVLVNQQAKFHIDDKLISEKIEYNKELGKIVGVHFVYKGCGSIDYMKLVDLGNNSVYHKDF